MCKLWYIFTLFAEYRVYIRILVDILYMSILEFWLVCVRKFRQLKELLNKLAHIKMTGFFCWMVCSILLIAKNWWTFFMSEIKSSSSKTDFNLMKNISIYRSTSIDSMQHFGRRLLCKIWIQRQWKRRHITIPNFVRH